MGGYTKEEIAKMVSNIMSVEDSEYIMTDDLERELDVCMGKYMAIAYCRGSDRNIQMPYVRRMFLITKLIIEQYDGSKITVTAQPMAEGKSQTPSSEGDRHTSDVHAGRRGEDATDGVKTNEK